MKEKYKLGLFFMKLVEDPSQFPHLEQRSGGGSHCDFIRLNLSQKQQKTYLDMLDKVKEYKVAQHTLKQER